MKREELVEFFSEFWEVPSEDITDALGLDADSIADFSSIRLFQFLSAVEGRFKVKFTDLDSLTTFGALCKDLQL